MPKGIPRDQSVEHKILHRLKITQGHLERVIAMVEKGDYCINIIHQSQAIQNALRETDSVMLENHLRTCVSEAIKKGNEEEVISEVLEVVKRQ